MKTTQPKKTYPADAVAEIRQIRAEIAAEHGDNLHAIFTAALRRQSAAGRRVIHRAEPLRTAKL